MSSEGKNLGECSDTLKALSGESISPCETVEAELCARLVRFFECLIEMEQEDHAVSTHAISEENKGE